MFFNSSTPPAASTSCPKKCADAKNADQSAIRGGRQLASANSVQCLAGKPVSCSTNAPAMRETADRLERYTEALPSARASQDLHRLGDADSSAVEAPCLTRLPLDAASLNKELGIDPSSPNAITDQDLRNDHTGYRAAFYRSESDGRIIMVSRDTQPNSLVDWKTNIENGQGKDTDQYKAARKLSSKMAAAGKDFDIAGYSKGGGLAQESGLVSPKSKVFVFNSAGLNNASLNRTSNKDFSSLQDRTRSFSSEGDFLTYMNNTPDNEGQLVNSQFLRDQLAGSNSGGAASANLGRMKITSQSPANVDPKDGVFIANRDQFLRDIDLMIANKRAAPDSGPLFPPVRAKSFDTIPNSTSWWTRQGGALDDGPSLGKLAQHTLDHVVGPMEAQAETDRSALKRYMQECG